MIDLEHVRNLKEKDAIETQLRLRLFLDMLIIANTALYTAAAGGNVTCRAAITQLEKLWKSKN